MILNIALFVLFVTRTDEPAPCKQAITNFVEFFQRKVPKVKMRPEYSYKNPVDILLDGVLNLNRNYVRFVVPRIEYFRNTHPSIKTLKALRSELLPLVKLHERGTAEELDEAMKTFWNYRHYERVEMLFNLTNFFLEYKRKVKITDDLLAMQSWAARVDLVTGDGLLPIRGFGLAANQYLRALLGEEAVKPDLHVKAVIQSVTGKRLSDRNAILFVEEIAKQMKLSPRLVAHSLWQVSSGNIYP